MEHDHHNRTDYHSLRSDTDIDSSTIFFHLASYIISRLVKASPIQSNSSLSLQARAIRLHFPIRVLHFCISDSRIQIVPNYSNKSI